MSHGNVWPHRAAQSASIGSTEPTEKLKQISSGTVTVPIQADGVDEFMLSISTVTSLRTRDGRIIIQHLLVLICKRCNQPVYPTVERISLEHLSTARSSAQFHMAECPEVTRNQFESPLRLISSETEPESPQG